MMKVVLLQNDVYWADPNENLWLNRMRLKQVPDADLYLFPEMFATGFVTFPVGVAEDLIDGTCPSLELMKEWAAAKDAAVCGSLAVHEGERYYNRFHFVKPDGSFITYDKRHLFTYGGEPQYFTPGQKRVVVEWRGMRFLLLVCYDLRFPLWSRNRGDFDAILYTANWPQARRTAWEVLTRARAIENQCYVLAANRIGLDPTGDYFGGTRVISPYGEILAEGGDRKEDFVAAEIDPEFIHHYWSKFPVLDDTDQALPPYTEAVR